MKSIGSGRPRVAVFACMHGDERYGARVLKRLETLKDVHGTLTLVIAHPRAMRQNVRYIKKDLNRSFPGARRGILEKRIAYSLAPLARKQDFVLDLHATRSRMERVAITPRLTKHVHEAIRATGIPKVVHLNATHFGKGVLLGVCRAGVALEYGRGFLHRKPEAPLQNVARILEYLGMIGKKSKRKVCSPLSVFDIVGTYAVPDGFREARGLSEFRRIRRGQLVGYNGSKKISARASFYPAFLGKGKYKNTLALMLQKRRYPRTSSRRAT